MSESMGIHDRTERDAGYAFILIFAVMAMGIVLIGYLYYLNYERNFRANVESELSSIAELKVGELAQWRKERLGDGAVLFKNTTFSALVRRFLENPGDTDAQSQLRAWMGKYLAAYQYARVYLVDTQGRIRMSVSEAPGSVNSTVARNVTAILRSGQVGIEDFHRNTPDGPIHLAVVVPIFDSADNSRPLGVLSMRIDPTTYLYSFISRWPTPSQTAETLLVRKDGNDVLFLNELRFHKNAALSLRIPLTKTEVPAVRAALGQTGIVEGVDYRGTPVIAAVKAVPDSPWYMVSKMNTSEVYAPARERLWQMAAFVGVLLFGSGAAMGFVWRQKSARYRERDKAAEAIRESEARFRQLAEATFEAVIVTESGRILDVNKSFLEMFGYEKAGEVVGRNSLEFVAPEYRELAAGHIAAGYDKPYEIMAIRKDGSHFPIEVHGRTVEIEGRRIRITAGRDMTERKKAEEALRRSEENLNRAQAVAQAGSWFINIPANRLEWSAETYRMFGVPQQDAIDLETFAAVVHPDDRDSVFKAWGDAMAGAPYDIEHRIVVKGETRWVRERAQIERDPEGRAITGIGTVQDITVSKRDKELLRESEQKFTRFFMMVPVPLGVVNNDGVINYFNDQFTEVFGYTVDDVPTIKEWWERAYPDESYQRWVLDTWGAAVAKAAKEGTQIEPIEYKVTCKSGEERIVLIGGAVLEDSVLATFVDVTERKRAEEALAESEGRFREIFNTVNDAIFIHDAETGRIIDVNRRMCEMYGLTHEEALACGADDLSAGTPPYSSADAFEKVCLARTEGPQAFDWLARAHDGHLFWVEVSLRLALIGGQQRILAVVRDITERKRAEEELRKLSQAVNQSSSSIAITDLDARIEYINETFAKETGYTFSEAVGQNPRLLKSGKTPNETYLDMWANLTNGKAWKGEFINRRKDGSEYIELALISPVRQPDGRITHYMAIKDNITERKRAEAELRLAKEQAEAATKLKDQFVSLVAHDLRSPFASMMGLIEHVTNQKPTPLNEENEIILNAALKSGGRMTRMIDELLQISRLQTGKITPQPRFFKGYMAAAVTIGSLSHNAAQKGIVVINEVPVNMRLYADQSLFDEVLLNLLSNAIKFCSRGDKITFFIPPGLKSAIAIRDTGKGISEAAIPNLFKHEVKTTTPGTAGELGTGLGLPYSQDIMKAHGGEITVESAPGKGTVFCAILPYVKPIALVVDDDPVALMVVRNHLEKIGIYVIEALGGEQALSAMSDRRPHIIITDIMMPEMDGFTLLDRLKKDSATKEIPVIVMTSADGEVRDKALRHGADDFVSKPIEVEDFIPRVRRFVG